MTPEEEESLISEKWRIIDEYNSDYSKISGIEQYDDLQERFDALVLIAKQHETGLELYSDFPRIEDVIKINFRRIFAKRCNELNEEMKRWYFRGVSIVDLKNEIRELCLQCEEDKNIYDYFDLLSQFKQIEEKLRDIKTVEQYKIKYNFWVLVGGLVAGFVSGIVASIVGYFILKSMGWL